MMEKLTVCLFVEYDPNKLTAEEVSDHLGPKIELAAREGLLDGITLSAIGTPEWAQDDPDTPEPELKWWLVEYTVRAAAGGRGSRFPGECCIQAADDPDAIAKVARQWIAIHDGYYDERLKTSFVVDRYEETEPSVEDQEGMNRVRRERGEAETEICVPGRKAK